MSEQYIFVCCHEKKSGKCCSAAGAEAAFNHLQRSINQKRDQIQMEGRVKVVKTSCLGRCAYGPNILIGNCNTQYTYNDLSDIDDIVDQHLVDGKPVEHLLNNI